jgi:hypothetical protein
LLQYSNVDLVVKNGAVICFKKQPYDFPNLNGYICTAFAFKIEIVLQRWVFMLRLARLVGAPPLNAATTTAAAAVARGKRSR